MKVRKQKKFSLISIFILIFTIYCIFLYQNQSSLLKNKQSELSELKTKLNEEKKLQSQLQDRLKNIDTDEEMQNIARHKLGLVKQGERIFVDPNGK